MLAVQLGAAVQNGHTTHTLLPGACCTTQLMKLVLCLVQHLHVCAGPSQAMQAAAAQEGAPGLAGGGPGLPCLLPTMQPPPAWPQNA